GTAHGGAWHARRCAARPRCAARHRRRNGAVLRSPVRNPARDRLPQGPLRENQRAAPASPVPSRNARLARTPHPARRAGGCRTHGELGERARAKLVGCQQSGGFERAARYWSRTAAAAMHTKSARPTRSRPLECIVWCQCREGKAQCCSHEKSDTHKETSQRESPGSIHHHCESQQCDQGASAVRGKRQDEAESGENNEMDGEMCP